VNRGFFRASNLEEDSVLNQWLGSDNYVTVLERGACAYGDRRTLAHGVIGPYVDTVQPRVRSRIVRP
jgi:hypothetical protein